MKMKQDRASSRFQRMLIVTVILCVLALVTMVVALTSPAFHFDKGNGHIMPDLIGKTEQEATDAIKAAGGNISVSKHYNDAAAGLVYEQSIPAGEAITPNQIVSIKVSQGPEPAPSVHDDWVSVPDLTNMTVDNAEKIAKKLDLKIVVGEYVFDDSVHYGAICQQSPARGISVAPGSEIHVNLSKGPQIVRYTITITCGAGGTVSPGGTQTVEEGKSKSFAITPDEGYEIDTLLIDGEAVTPTFYYQFSDVDKNHTISVTFRQTESVIVF